MVSTVVGGHYWGLSVAKKRRKRRHWDDDEKREIVAQTRVPVFRFPAQLPRKVERVCPSYRSLLQWNAFGLRVRPNSVIADGIAHYHRQARGSHREFGFMKAKGIFQKSCAGRPRHRIDGVATVDLGNDFVRPRSEG